MAVNAAPSGKAPPAFGEVAVGLGTLLGSVRPTPRALSQSQLSSSGLDLQCWQAKPVTSSQDVWDLSCAC